MIRNVRNRTDRAAALAIQLQGGAQRVQAWDVDLDDGEHVTVLLSLDTISTPREVPDARWHLSAAGSTRVLTWAELVEIAHRFRPGIMFSIALPPRTMWLNLHEHCLHLWQMRDASLERQFAAEGRQARSVPS